MRSMGMTMGTTMRSLVLVLTFALTLGLGAGAPAGAGDLHPNTQSGVAIAQSFGGSDLDQVNLYNGSLTVTLPLGPRFQVGDRLSYGFTLVNNSGPWTFSQEQTFDERNYTHSEVTDCGANPTALGWRLGLGNIVPAHTAAAGCFEASQFPIYQSPDGSAHRFYPTLSEAGLGGAFYTRDGTYLRLRMNVEDTPYLLEFPDGTRQKFNDSGQLLKMEDPFGNSVTFSLGGNPWKIKDSWNRESTVKFEPGLITLEVPAYLTGKAKYELTTVSRNLRRGCTVLGVEDHNPQPEFLEVTLLDEVRLPDNSTYRMQYHESDCYSSGSLQSLDLRTGGRIEWSYGNYNFPQTSTPKIHNQNSLGVVSRTLKVGYNPLTDPLCTGGAQQCSWTYVQTPGTVQTIESVTTVTDPYGSQTKNYFSVATNNNDGGSTDDYAAPFSPIRPYSEGADPAGKLYLSTEVLDAAGTLQRQTYLSFEHDPAPSTDSDGFATDAANENRRVRHQRAVFADDNGKWIDTAFSDFDGVGHYRTSRTRDNFGFQTDHFETTRWNPLGLPGPGSPWILSTFDLQEQKEGGSVLRQWASFDPATGFLNAFRRYRTTAPGPRDVLVKYLHDDTSAPGQVSSESWYGGGTQRISTVLSNWQTPAPNPVYTYQHAYDYGVRKQTTVQVQNPDGGSHPEKLLDLDLDANTGLTKTSSDTSGHATDFTYDQLNRVTRTAPPGVAATVLAFDLNASEGPLVTATVGSDLEKEEWTLDPFGRIGQNAATLPGPVATAGGGSVNQAAVKSRTFALYNPMGWKTFVSEAAAGGSSFGSAFTYTHSYSLPNGQKVTVPDPFGRPWKITGADGAETHFAYVGARIVRRSGTTLQQIKPEGSSTWTTLPVWGTTVERYDGLGRLREVRDAAGTTTSYGYDAGGRLVSVTSSGGRKTQARSFQYDGRGFLFREKPAESEAITYSYDAKGNVTSRATPAGTVDYTYDAAGRVTKMATPEAPLKEFRFGTTVETLGKLVTATAYNYQATDACREYKVEESYRYEGPGGRLSKVETTLFDSNVQKEKWAQDYLYDSTGRVEQIDYPRCLTGCATAARSFKTTYRYGRPVAVTDLASPTVDLAGPITYNENGTLATVQHANGVLYTQGIDPKRIARPKSIRAERSGVALWPQEDYAFDEAGNITQIGGKRFTYDGLSRLTSATYPAVPGQPYREYLYDRFGNLTDVNRGTQKADPATVTVSYPTSTTTNQLEAPAAIYDKTGRLLSYSNTLYTWDLLDQMAKVDATAAGSEAWIHIYNSAGERVWSWRTSGSRQDTFTLRDPGGKVLTLFNKLPGTTPTYTWEDYVYREGQLLAAKMSDGAVKHFDLDHLGSVRLETNAAGAVLAYRDFWPYGEETTTPTATERMKFTGHERDLGVLGSNVDDLDYMHARYYRPLVGRFLSMDPGVDTKRAQRNPQGWNRYALVENNPQRFADLDGREIGLDVNMLAKTSETPAQSMAMGAGVGLLAVGLILAPEVLVAAAPISEALFAMGVKHQGVIDFFRNMGAAATDTPVAGNLSRSLTAADLGLKGAVTELKGTFSVAEGMATVKVDMIDAAIQNPLKIVDNLIKLAAESGASTLRIEGKLANPRFLSVLARRYGMQTQDNTEYIVIVIKK